MSWFYESAGHQAGPVDDAALAGLVNAGTVAGPTLVWRPGMAAWQPYQEVWAASAAAASGQHPALSDAGNGSVATAVARAITPAGLLAGFGYCTECGRGHASDDLAPVLDRRVCGACKPALLQRLREGALQALAAQRYAGFWIRTGAAVLDSVIQTPVNLLVSFLAIWLLSAPNSWGMTSSGSSPGLRAQLAANAITQLASFGLQLAYSTFFVGRFGATPGMLICGLRVRRSDGSALTYRRALLRALANMLNHFTLGLSYILVAIDSEKRGVHDYLCDTRVTFK
jgi:uncharacterized RDD family membrane protein YckC